jgi:hypothetical protein
MWAPLAYRLQLELLPPLLLLLLLRRRRRRLLLRLPLHSTLDAQAVRSASSDLRASTPPAKPRRGYAGQEGPLLRAHRCAPEVQQSAQVQARKKNTFVFIVYVCFRLL